MKRIEDPAIIMDANRRHACSIVLAAHHSSKGSCFRRSGAHPPPRAEELIGSLCLGVT